MDIRRRKSERDRIAIVAEILEMAREGVLKTNIMYRAGLNSIMLSKYVGLMMSAKLLEKVLLNGRVVFKATKKGMEFLHYCYEITRLLETDDGKNKLGERVQLLPSSLYERSTADQELH
jgi:predicted transcriptional regulator